MFSLKSCCYFYVALLALFIGLVYVVPVSNFARPLRISAATSYKLSRWLAKKAGQFEEVAFYDVSEVTTADVREEQDRGVEGTIKPEESKLSSAWGRELQEHSKQFARDVIKVTHGVHVFIGFGIANVVLMFSEDEDDDDGQSYKSPYVIVDTLESREAAEDLVQSTEYRDLTKDRELAAIIYTHKHQDHINGAMVFLEFNEKNKNISKKRWEIETVRIIAHRLTADALTQLNDDTTYLHELYFRRGMFQFGSTLPAEERVNSGIGAELHFNTSTFGVVVASPNWILEDEENRLTIPGFGARTSLTEKDSEVIIYHAPGETSDQIVIHIPFKQLFLGADNYYRAFPNLYAIRGSPYRNVQTWFRTLDMMVAIVENSAVRRSIDNNQLIQHMVLQHGRPIINSHSEILTRLTNYRNGVKFVHDQSLRCFINLGTPDECGEKVFELWRKSPFYKLDYLRQYYGMIPWSVKSIFSGNLGWFSGEAMDLRPLSRKDRARRMLEFIIDSSNFKTGGSAGAATGEDGAGGGETVASSNGGRAMALLVNAAEQSLAKALKLEESEKRSVSITLVPKVGSALSDPDIQDTEFEARITRELQWGLELSTMVTEDLLHVRSGRRRESMEIEEVQQEIDKADVKNCDSSLKKRSVTVHTEILKTLAKRQISAPAHNWYMTAYHQALYNGAQFEEENLIVSKAMRQHQIVHVLPLIVILQNFQTRIIPELSEQYVENRFFKLRIEFIKDDFQAPTETFALTVHDLICDVNEVKDAGLGNSAIGKEAADGIVRRQEVVDLVLRTTELIFRRVIAGVENPLAAAQAGKLRLSSQVSEVSEDSSGRNSMDIVSDVGKLVEFLSMFQV